ncbi:MAG: cytochrome B [Gammaproteobacteria bacterium]|nr:cytochrome B [Gammaproteobacteria bacterium]NIR85288.1 cytochrome B [Gammaproteobacteria bacterium]NIR88404.1 cytochrome B [Gammaproteobacteria bacterium]NIU06354.1 cytochrome B [Gammaproteobacteria bacterium]NIV53253.1 cytochrome B [Gammaproteobacteria bacterium]
MEQAYSTRSDVHGTTIRVWDPLVRVLHWTVVIAFFVAYFTEEDLLTAHTWAGYAAGAVVVLRVIWGFVGPHRARFSDFLYSPAAVARYLIDLLTLRGGKRYLGHSPTGGLMVVVLLVALAATVWSGLMVLALEEGAGPLAGYASAQPAPAATTAYASEHAEEGESDEEEDDDEEEEGEEGAGEYWEELHEFFANLTLALVIVHVAGVLLASYVHRENLIKAMFTGTKRSNGA